MQDAALDILRSRLTAPLTLIDVGARWGTHGRWDALGDLARIVGFEPDPIECARLAEAAAPNVRYLPVGLAEAEGPRALYVTREPACSSLHKPVAALVGHYPALVNMTVVGTEVIECRRLDDVLEEEGIEGVAALKLDTQGSELAILKGATRALASCAIIDIEVEFNPLYQGQGLFCDVDRYLRDHGFVLWRIDDLVHHSTQVVPSAYSDITIAAAPPHEPRASVTVPNGQLFWAQAQYVRAAYPRTGADVMDAAEALPAAALAGVYGFWDLALELVRKTGDVALLERLEHALLPAPEPPPASVEEVAELAPANEPATTAPARRWNGLRRFLRRARRRMVDRSPTPPGR